MDSYSNLEVNFTRNVINIVVHFQSQCSYNPLEFESTVDKLAKILKIDTIFSKTHQFDRFTRNTHDLNVVNIDIYL